MAKQRRAGLVTDRGAVLKAVKECDRLGRAQFLSKYGYAPAKAYFLLYAGRKYDSKAIVGVAFGHQYDTKALENYEFTGGAASVKLILERLGFVVKANDGEGFSVEICSASLNINEVYTRNQLRSKFSITASSINNGVFRPSGSKSIWLFVTNEKPKDRPQLVDRLEGDILYWQGQPEGRTDKMLIDHEANGEEIILFYRDRVRQYDGAGFRYEGRFAYVSHEGGKPASFVFKRYSERSTDRLIEKQIDFDPGSVEDAREATLGAIRRRQGQAKFRADLMDAYDGRCAVTGCQYAPLLEAAHIHPYRGRETNHVSNGLLLRADIHTLFDLGLIAVFPDGALDICPTLAATEYASLSRLMFPKKVAARPSDKALAWHRREVATKEARAALSAKLKAL